MNDQHTPQSGPYRVDKKLFHFPLRSLCCHTVEVQRSLTRKISLPQLSHQISIEAKNTTLKVLFSIGDIEDRAPGYQVIELRQGFVFFRLRTRLQRKWRRTHTRMPILFYRCDALHFTPKRLF